MSSHTRPQQPGIQLHVDLDGDLRPHRSVKIEAHLRVDVSADGAPTDLPAVELAVIIAVDVAQPHREAVRRALPAALRALPDGISFTVLGSGPEPVRCYPRGDDEWAVADQRERRRAAFAVGSLPLHGDGPRPAGYAAWAARSRALLVGRPLSVRHLVLITDGSSAPGETRLEEELDACAGQFTCDVLAVGAEWAPDPLLTLAERLHGTAEFVEDGLARKVTAAIKRLRRVHTPQLPIEVTVRPSVRQVSLSEKVPRPHRLGGLPQPGRPHRWSFPTYQWEQGRRDYLLTLVADADADPLETELQFAMVSVGEVHAPVIARWHRPAQPPPHAPAGADSVRDLNATGRMRSALRQGLVALQDHRRDRAEECLGQAARLAAEFGTDWVLAEIHAVADIEDAAAGRVRLRTAVDAGTLGPMILRAGSRPGGLLTEAVNARPGPRCGGCGTVAGSEARYCIACGEKLL
ncbi:VWA domain-containing protein [Streptomyces sp. NBC_00201]|uniref:vWA domain-containing protein n=1 Tax=unclassified Streptomyces TaxID=2593676 RepID=UPI00224CA885|nr:MULTISPECIES: VWA domain-containing protein [unclassified Streptomyces]MCX5243942.1 VWA domain-containing protein [Streptomyces sp. NBC_00201]MCX5290324.1 VWA domain-containing protein [Streptomyces sp. NBC_00183]